MTFEIKHFQELSLDEFHELISLRISVFVVEQNCPYQELDGKDISAFHLLLREDSGKIIGTTRILPAGVSYNQISIGRVAIDTKNRGKDFGHKIVEESINFIQNKWGNEVPIKISAQKHLENFYEKHLFVSTGKEYLEDEIPHVEMTLN